MIKKICFVIILFLCFTLFLFPTNSQEAVQESLKIFSTHIEVQAVAGVGNIVFEDKKIGSNYSLYLLEIISQELQINPKFEYSDRNQLDLIMTEIKLGLSGMTEDSTSPEPGMLKGLDYIIYGNYFDEGLTVNLFLKLIDIETGLTVENTSYLIDKKSIPPDIAILPDNYNDALYILDELSNMLEPGSDKLEIRCWSSRGEGGIYKDGENLQINFYSSNACYIKIYHIDVNKDLSLIFPNPYYSDNLINAGRIYKIPDNSYPFNFTLGEPYGVEFIKVVASTLQFNDIEEAFSELGTATPTLLSRGLRINKKPAMAAEELFSYTIVE